MDAIRCLDCGDVRWSLLGLKGRPGECTMCGGEMVPERRRPAAGTPGLAAERRDLADAREPVAAGARPSV
jgi:hypothetical protein